MEGIIMQFNLGKYVPKKEVEVKIIKNDLPKVSVGPVDYDGFAMLNPECYSGERILEWSRKGGYYFSYYTQKDGFIYQKRQMDKYNEYIVRSYFLSDPGGLRVFFGSDWNKGVKKGYVSKKAITKESQTKDINESKAYWHRKLRGEK